MVGRILVFFFLLAPFAFGSEIVEVGFMELRGWDGKVRLYEPDFRFAHVAIRVGENWLHAHPMNGVEWVEQTRLEKIGRLALRVAVHQSVAVSWANIAPLIGRPYDADFSWGDDKMYCSELVAKVLGIPPEPMHFDPKLWPAPYLKLEGRPGISPGGLFRALAHPERLCSSQIAAS